MDWSPSGAAGRGGRAGAGGGAVGLVVVGRSGPGLVDAVGQSLDLEGMTTSIMPTTTAQMPPTVISAARVAPGSARASTPSGTSSRPRISHSHQPRSVSRAANAPAMVTVPMTISHAPRKMATASSPGLGRTMIATPAPIDNRPVTVLVVWGQPVQTAHQGNRDALQDEQRADEDRQTAHRPVDTEDQHGGDDERQSVDQQQRPVAG